jgi:hypothetical protein
MKLLALLACVAVLSGCAAGYESRGGRGGWEEKKIEENFYRLTYSGNGATTQETVQTYWLYRAAELSVEKGFDGFEIASQINFVGAPSDSPYIRTQMMLIPIPIAKFPVLQADIILLKAPIVSNPPKVFDARSLMAELNPYVKAEKKCESGNVCPHFKRYLRPKSSSPQASFDLTRGELPAYR